MSIKLYRTSDRIPIKIGDAIFRVSPLTKAQKISVQSMIMKENGDLIEDTYEKAALLFKYSIKGVEGVEYATGGNYVVEMEDGVLSDKCVDDLLNMEEKNKLAVVLWSFVDSIKSKAIAPDGKPLKGVEILPPEGSEFVKK